jgi:pesticin/yersiniabactin receptor
MEVERVSLGYQLPKQVRLYGVVSRGYKPGMFNRFVLSAGDAIPVDPEKSWNYEVGVKSALLDRKQWLDVSTYWIDSKDGQVFVLMPKSPDHQG